MVADPYKTLGLSHDVTKSEIKKAYRALATKCHPDVLTRARASKEEIQKATSKFAAISAAYAILSDDARKRHYDHIYKYGGYDEKESVDSSINNAESTYNVPIKRYESCRPASKRHNSGSCYDERHSDNKHKERTKQQHNKQKQKGIGYAVYDPFTFIVSQGQIKSKSVAGVSIPSRFNMMHSGNGGLRISFSTGEIRKTASGSMKFTSKTTQFANGKKLSRCETTTVRRDGRKEVIIEEDDYIERRVSALPKRKRLPSKDEDDLTRTGSPEDETPWYMNAWNGVIDSVQMCTTGHCGTISVR